MVPDAVADESAVWDEDSAMVPDAVADEVPRSYEDSAMVPDAVADESFTPTESAAYVCRAIARYLSMENEAELEPNRVGSAFVVHGRSGVGKTYIMSQAVQDASARCAATGGVVVVRFLGTTPDSSNVHALLKSLCGQIGRILPDVNGKGTQITNLTDFKDLCAEFRGMLSRANIHRRK
ncbi:hypothetical protein T484DRAFT_1790988 [Baffinella frigidus]|nr:hypothetical protein T484DRAFT_1790988 [Cryptophyta sp. CCMP2293]